MKRDDPDARRLTHRFTTLVFILGLCDVYWLPEIRRIAARSPYARIRIPLPHDAVYVGRYAHPVSTSEHFLDDLHDAIRRLAS